MKRFIMAFIFVCLSFVVFSISQAETADNQRPPSATNEEIRALTTKFRDLLECIESQCPESATRLERWTYALKRLGTREGFMDWMRTFNLKKLGERAYRIYQMESRDPKFVEHVANLAFLFPASHATEVTLGFTLPIISSALGAPPEVTAGLGAAGGIVSIPFVADPLCWAFYFSYPASATFRNVITYTRTKTMPAINFVGTVTGVNALARGARGFLHAAWEEKAFQTLTIDEDGILVRTGALSPQKVFYLEWLKNDEAEFKYLSSVTFDPDFLSRPRDEQWKADWKTAMQALPYNVKLAVREALQTLDGLSGGRGRTPFYVRMASIDRLKVVWRDRSVVAGSDLETCAHALRVREPEALPPGR